MARDLHTVSVVDGSTIARQDRLIIAHLPAQSNAAGASAGATVAVAVTGLSLPNTYSVFASASQAAFVSVGSKTNGGFTVTLTPTSGSATLSAGTVDILVVA